MREKQQKCWLNKYYPLQPPLKKVDRMKKEGKIARQQKVDPNRSDAKKGKYNFIDADVTGLFE